ncbi:MAG: ribonuclease III [Chloroflexi bacterium]|nr:ribonuclease III [Chloroflexota bacterium]
MERTPLELAIRYTFKDKGLLQQALTHPSYPNEHPEAAGVSNQRLEFLGDACIGLVVGRNLYERYPDVDEGPLTEARSRLVRRETLARAARRVDLGAHLIMGAGEEARGGRDRDSNLADAFEALVGAVLLDRGYPSARGVVLRVLRPELRELEPGATAKDPKSQLQELAHSMGLASPEYETVKAEGPPHQPLYTVEVRIAGEALGQGQGLRKVEAERRAAQQAVERLVGG